MSFDGGFARNLTAELAKAAGCRIDKLYQPSADELVFLLRKKGFVKRMLISAKPGAARVQFTEYASENPQNPPMFCMLARKYFSSAKIVSVEQKGFERLIEFTFETSDELKDRSNPRIVCELIGNQSNIILINGEGRIIDAVRRSDISSEKRMIQPGALYEYPKAQEKTDISLENADEAAKSILKNKDIPLSRSITETIGGVSPLIGREISFKAAGDTEALTDECRKDRLTDELEFFSNSFSCGGKPFMLSKDSVPKDYSYMPILQYGTAYELEEYPSFSALLDAFYHKKEAAARIKKLSNDISRLLNTLISRAERRMAGRSEELERSNNRESLRIYGELIKANIHKAVPGAKYLSAVNFYDEDMKEIKIPLDPSLNAAANAAKYFKEYKKSCTAAQTLSQLIESDRKEIDYLESVLYSLSQCESAADISEIRDELRSDGYISDKTQGRKKPARISAFKEYKSPEGYRIAVGKNNLQNDILTLKTASKNDIWFHTKNIHGSHVILFCGGKPVSDDSLRFAASLAAANSKAADSSNVPVDYTFVKYVKKPSGAKPGKVIYTNNRTVYITPLKDGNL